MIVAILAATQSFSFFNAVGVQEFFWLILTFSGLSAFLAITFLLEVNRAPFDLSEAESELIAGYTIEYGGFFFGLYYLGEYLHLFFFSLAFSCFFFGG